MFLGFGETTNTQRMTTGNHFIFDPLSVNPRPKHQCWWIANSMFGEGMEIPHSWLYMSGLRDVIS